LFLYSIEIGVLLRSITSRSPQTPLKWNPH